MRRLSGKNRTEFSPRVPIDSQIFPFCPLFRVISYLRHCGGTRFFKFGPIVSHSCFSWGLGRPMWLSAVAMKSKGLGKRQMLSGFSNAIANCAVYIELGGCRLSADTSRGAVRPAQASSTIDRTHDHILPKSKGLSKRQMLSGFSNAIALRGGTA